MTNQPLPDTLREYISTVINVAGSDLAVGVYLGLADGSRVGAWRKGRGRPSELMCVNLARWQGDDPLAVLRLAGYVEMADLLSGHVPDQTGSNTHSVTLLQHQLQSLRSMIDMALTQTGSMGATSEKAHGYPSHR
jgi:hypothetical protein